LFDAGSGGYASRLRLKAIPIKPSKPEQSSSSVDGSGVVTCHFPAAPVLYAEFVWADVVAKKSIWVTTPPAPGHGDVKSHVPPTG